MNSEKMNAIKGAIRDGKMVQAAGGITISAEQSDKLGFDWTVYSVNDVVVRKTTSSRKIPSARARRILLNMQRAYR
jgi:hypothetical protein